MLSFAEILTNDIGQETVTGSALNGKKEYLKAEVGDQEKWDFLNFAQAWTPSETVKGDSEDDKDGIFFSHVRKNCHRHKLNVKVTRVVMIPLTQQIRICFMQKF